MANPYVRQWQVNSWSRKGGLKFYTVSQRADGSFACDCPIWKYKPNPRQDCKHILEIKLKESETSAEQARRRARELDQETADILNARALATRAANATPTANATPAADSTPTLLERYTSVRKVRIA
jgi:hypothetical protein